MGRHSFSKPLLALSVRLYALIIFSPISLLKWQGSQKLWKHHVWPPCCQGKHLLPAHPTDCNNQSSSQFYMFSFLSILSTVCWSWIFSFFPLRHYRRHKQPLQKYKDIRRWGEEPSHRNEHSENPDLKPLKPCRAELMLTYKQVTVFFHCSGKQHLTYNLDLFFLDLYLEELSDVLATTDIECQTDAFLDRPATPLFIPAKTGKDVATQIEEGEVGKSHVWSWTPDLPIGRPFWISICPRLAILCS